MTAVAFYKDGGQALLCRRRRLERVGMRSLGPLALALIVLQPGQSAAYPTTITDTKERLVQEAKGHFDIEMKPQSGAVDGVARSLVTKQFRGDMEGTSEGEMLSVRTATPGSAGYVLIERVTAKIAGKSGSFMIQHFGIMERTKPELKAEIIPDSGTDGFVGIKGGLTINPADNHSYVLTYLLPGS